MAGSPPQPDAGAESVPVLGIDTATSRASIALARAGSLLEEVPLEERGAHAHDLLPRIELLLRGQGLEPRDLRAIGVSVGPGSFTGVRVGMATAKGLAYALGIGCAGLSTLEALARAADRTFGPRAAVVCPALDAGRGEVYAALFRSGSRGAGRPGEDRSWRPQDLLGELPPEAALVGDGAASVARAGTAIGRDHPVLEPWPHLAGAIALWVAGARDPTTIESAGALRPNYVRPAGAEVKRRRP